ncbi:LysM peptidoglycan-binding domain-containing protein [Pontibacter sp. MBLB2868]|uniref:LysM peptidoglycan-binding domain-containing protein n=1 Tax=Pontibacter sp. MBLB2868 TaxID=3451555 RepID=UPI003F74F484
MRKQLPLLVLLLLPLLTLAQNVTVPKNVYFADVHLRISDEAQQLIQKKVDALHRNQSYFQVKVELADAYFPIIERVFKAEGVPDDFKYLALQESGLIGDAVSTSNAVGYWQFKKEAAMDFNLRMDNVVDERRHIIEASRGAAKYFKRSNSNYDNWFTSLLSYYLGYTGVKTYSSPSDKGSKKMEVTEKSHPYVITFLAHKIAYDNFVGKNKPALSLHEMRATPGQSLADIALSTKTDFAELEKYNKWLLGNSIPSDKDYYVMVPVRNGERGVFASKSEISKPVTTTQQMAAAVMVKRNGLNALIARPNDTKDKLALQAGISTRKFLRYNDLHNFDPIVPGTAYYIEKKNLSAEKDYHVVQPGETMQMISQHYGIRLTYLLFKNRMSRSEVPVPGRVLWLQKRRPSSIPVEVRDLNQKQSIATTTPDNTRVVANKQTVAENDAPQENIFKRFINSLKRFKKEPEQEEEQETATTPVPVAQAAPVPTVKEEPQIKNEKAAVKSISTPATSQPEQATSQVPVTDTKPAPAALYPVTKEPAATQTEPKQNAQPVKAAEEVLTAKKQEEVEEVEPLLQKPVEEIEEEADAVESTPKTQVKAIAPKPARHQVKQGETLYSISRMYAVTVNDLNTWNILGDEPLKLGQELLIAEPLTTPAAKPVQESNPVAVSSVSQSANGYHTVVKGETLYQISKTYNVSLEDLRTWNNLPDNNIRPGQELRISAPASAASPVKASEEEKVVNASASTSGTLYHTVAAGESMYQISRKYGATIKDIMEWNNKSDFSVSIGEKLLVKKK